ncbi:hypothetical protein IAQ61_008249 [Plenodomus lingam]|uniref:uncharacterized protein n=1 Tax=Leptosphaeria maculans TaxID=5022 RepID=UPI003331AC79|nr:hypothetical protein IAQ61_008249 [Plenodomus lingam]
MATTSALPASNAPAYDHPSDGFHLIIKSSNLSFDGFALAACHRGAAVESLCQSKARAGSDPRSLYRYYHKASSYNAVNAGGSLIYVLQMMGGQQVPSAMHFSDRKGTNTQEMMFQPGEGDGSAQISFDESGGMWKDGSAEKWYMCETTSGYPMNLLVWVNGDAPTPQEPACQKVKVQRIWA